MQRSNAELVAQSPHLFWHLRQLLNTSAHVEQCRRDGRSVLHDPIDAAVLEAFALSARVLIEFFWRDRKPIKGHRPPHKDDALAVDWFPDGGWNPGAKPPELENVSERVGWGVAHLSFRRCDRTEEWGWQHLDIAHRLAYWFAVFATTVSPQRVAEHFRREVEAEIVEGRMAVDDAIPFEHIFEPPGPVGTPTMSHVSVVPESVGTPMHPTTIAALRRSTETSEASSGARGRSSRTVMPDART